MDRVFLLGLAPRRLSDRGAPSEGTTEPAGGRGYGYHKDEQQRGAHWDHGVGRRWIRRLGR